MMLASDLRERTLAAAKEQASATRGQARVQAAVILALAIAASLAVFVWAGGVRATGRPLVLILGTSLGAAGFATVAAWGAIGRGGSMLGRPRRWLLLVVIGVPLALFGWKMVVTALFTDMLRSWPGRLGFRCLKWSLLMGLGPLAALAIVRRDSESVRPALTGAAMGIAAGAGAWVMTDLWCPVGFPPHVLLGHLLPTLLLGALGALLGAKLLAIRS